MENYISPSVDVISIEFETSFANSPGFNVPDGGDNGNENWDGGGYSAPSNWD
mgnify:FL=1